MFLERTILTIISAGNLSGFPVWQVAWTTAQDILTFVQPEYSLLYSQEPAIGLQPELDKSSP
jgi:hypothetical protein